MSNQEIVDLADKAGITFVTQSGVASATVEWLQKFASLVADRERLKTRQWQGLTELEFRMLYVSTPDYKTLWEAIEAKLKEKNNA